MKIIGIIDIDGTITNLDFFKLTNKATILDANLNRFNIKIFRLILYKIVLLYSKNIKTRDNVKYALNELKNFINSSVLVNIIPNITSIKNLSAVFSPKAPVTTVTRIKNPIRKPMFL